MAFIGTISPQNAEGEVRALYAHQQNSWGYVPNYAKVFCYRPELMRLWANLLAGIRKHVDPRRFEIVTLSAAHELKHSACSLAHGKALTRFFSEDEVVKIATDPENSPLDEAELAMARFARKVAGAAHRVSEDDIRELKENGFSDEEIFDIAITAAARAFFTKVLDALGVEPDQATLAMNEKFRNALTVGREISKAEDERLGQKSNFV